MEITIVNVLTWMISIGAVMTSTIVAFTMKKNDAHIKKEDARANMRVEETQLMMKMVHATALCTNATCMAVLNKKINGEMTAAQSAMQEAQEEYQDFLIKVTAEAKERNL